MALTYCDWCGAYCECEKCDDPVVKKARWEMDNPMQHHIHACSDEHESYWEHPHYWSEREGDEPELCTGCNYGKPDCKCNGTDESTKGETMSETEIKEVDTLLAKLSVQLGTTSGITNDEWALIVSSLQGRRDALVQFQAIYKPKATTVVDSELTEV